jgi:hypothetical protein
MSQRMLVYVGEALVYVALVEVIVALFVDCGGRRL